MKVERRLELEMKSPRPCKDSESTQTPIRSMIALQNLVQQLLSKRVLLSVEDTMIRDCETLRESQLCFETHFVSGVSILL